MKKYDISCNNINLFFLSSLDIKTDPQLYNIFFLVMNLWIMKMFL